MNSLDEIRSRAKHIEFIATDVDDTLTINGILTSGVLDTLEFLNRIGKKIILVTGRSGGACTTLAQYLPVASVIAENGGVIIKKHDLETVKLPKDHRERLNKCFNDIRGNFPSVVPAQDNQFRLTDMSIENTSVPDGAINKIKKIAFGYGLMITISSIQTHIISPRFNKASTLKKIVKKRETITIGDSINDESMFNPAIFPLSAGVSNIKKYLKFMKYHPRWIMDNEQGHGFIEFAEIIRSKYVFKKTGKVAEQS